MPKRQAKKRSPATPPRSREIAPEISVEAAVAQVERWILAGESDHDIKQHIGREFPQFEADVLYGAAVLKISQNANLPDGTIFGFCIAATLNIYSRAMRNGETKIALDAVKQLAALQKSKPAPQPEEEPDC